MKYFESSFDDYISSVKKYNIHKKYSCLYKLYSNDIKNLKNIIFYGPKGIGKYSQALTFIKKYSPSKLKYEKKFSINFQKKHNYIFKMSDMHFEINMELLGCNAKLLWNDIFNHIKDIISIKPDNTGFIICKNFHCIHNELLEVFYNYIQNINNLYNIKFILLTEQISFIPSEIYNTCDIIHFGRPSKSTYGKIIAPLKLDKNINIKMIKNIKNLKSNITQLSNINEKVCNKIIQKIVNLKELDMLEFRDNIYDILVYHLDIHDCLWYILNKFVKLINIKPENMCNINIELFKFFKYYNNNYRPIYHLERILLYISSIVHELPTSIKHIRVK